MHWGLPERVQCMLLFLFVHLRGSIRENVQGKQPIVVSKYSLATNLQPVVEPKLRQDHRSLREG